MKCLRQFTLLLLMGSIVAGTGTCQSTSLRALLPSAPVPDRVLYWALFRHVNHLVTKASAQGAQTDSATYYRRAAHLSALEDNSLKAIAKDCVQQVTEEDAKAMSLIHSIRAQYPNGLLPNHSALPAVPPELLSMQKDRDRIIDAHIAQLKASFAGDDFSRFDHFVRTRVAPSISMVPLIQRRPGNSQAHNSPYVGVSR